MLLHFIFVIKEADLEKRKKEFEYVKQMAQFYKFWIKETFGKKIEIKCDEMITKSSGLFHKFDTSHLLKDHKQRGENIFHFYLCHFRPLWTDCTCEGYSADNFGMIYWQTPKKEDDILFLAEKNCTTVSHELAHEFLRQAGNKKYVEVVHDVWTKHHLSDLPYDQYGLDYKKTNGVPYFLTINTEDFRL